MSQISIDPISYSNALQKAGMPKAQADVIAQNQQAAMERVIDMRNLVTRQDLQVALAEAKADLIKWLVGGFIAQTALTLSVLAYIIK